MPVTFKLGHVPGSRKNFKNSTQGRNPLYGLVAYRNINQIVAVINSINNSLLSSFIMSKKSNETMNLNRKNMSAVEHQEENSHYILIQEKVLNLKYKIQQCKNDTQTLTNLLLNLSKCLQMYCVKIEKICTAA